jgi:hypothetical protein
MDNSNFFRIDSNSLSLSALDSFRVCVPLIQKTCAWRVVMDNGGDCRRTSLSLNSSSQIHKLQQKTYSTNYAKGCLLECLPWIGNKIRKNGGKVAIDEQRNLLSFKSSRSRAVVVVFELCC